MLRDENVKVMQLTMAVLNWMKMTKKTNYGIHLLSADLVTILFTYDEIKLIKICVNQFKSMLLNSFKPVWVTQTRSVGQMFIFS